MSDFLQLPMRATAQSFASRESRGIQSGKYRFENGIKIQFYTALRGRERSPFSEIFIQLVEANEYKISKYLKNAETSFIAGHSIITLITAKNNNRARRRRIKDSRLLTFI